MVEPRVFMAVLAAGSSRRFGEEDKLLASFKGKALSEHVCAALPLERAVDAYVITSQPDHPCEAQWREAGFDVAINTESSKGMGTSIALAAEMASKAGCDSILVALADMPLVPRSHFETLLGAYKGLESKICSSDGAARMPPAVFGSACFGELMQLNGDRGARRLLAGAQAIKCPPGWLADIDTPEALKSLD